jgi:4-amino-4-deoxy-L-arabinose transferase-like glycosyltransferase
LPWPLYVIAHIPGVVELWRFESIGELSDNLRNARPWYFYIPQLFYIALPWTAWWIGGTVLAIHKRSRRRLFPLIWFLLTVAAFSFVHMKKNAYLLPAMPAMAICSAQGIVRMMAWARTVKDNAFIGLAARAHAVIGIGLAVATSIMLLLPHLAPLLLHWMPRRALSAAGLVTSEGAFVVPLSNAPVAIAVSASALLIAALPFCVHPTRQFDKWFRLQAFAFATVIFLFIAFPAPDRKNQRPGNLFTTPSATTADLPDDE